MKLDASITVFEVSPLADPARGGRWVSIQLWADQGSVRVRQLAELKARLVTPEGHDPTAEVEELTRALLAVARETELAQHGRLDTVTLGGAPYPKSEEV